MVCIIRLCSMDMNNTFCAVSSAIFIVLEERRPWGLHYEPICKRIKPIIKRFRIGGPYLRSFASCVLLAAAGTTPYKP
jgi:hypothetical protein